MKEKLYTDRTVYFVDTPINIASPTGDCDETIYGLQVKQSPWNLSMFDTSIRNYKLKKLDNTKK